MKGTDANLNKTASNLSEVTVLVDGKTENPIVSTLSEKDDSEANKVKYVLTLSELDKISGKVEIVIPAGTLQDTAEIPNISAAKTIDLGLVDLINPKWEKPTSSVNNTNKTIEISLKGSDSYLTQSFTSTSADDIEVYLENETEPKADVTKTLTVNYTPEGEGVQKTAVTASLVLGNLGNYEGTVKVVIPEDALKDTRGNGSEVLEHTTASIDFKQPEWKDAISGINKNNQTVEIFLEGLDLSFQYLR